jgi:molecular chaperone GrpE
MTAKKSSQKKKPMHEMLKQHINDLELEVSQIKNELRQKNEKLLRTCADLQNYQKRTEKEREHTVEELRKKYLSELLDLYELLQKASNDANPSKGLQLILANLQGFFEREHISYIDCVGKHFDHSLHHAVNTVEMHDAEDNMIVEEVKKGYKMGEKLLRPSQVIVVKNKEDK